MTFEKDIKEKVKDDLREIYSKNSVYMEEGIIDSAILRTIQEYKKRVSDAIDNWRIRHPKLLMRNDFVELIEELKKELNIKWDK